jgi:hypothetical protein
MTAIVSGCVAGTWHNLPSYGALDLYWVAEMATREAGCIQNAIQESLEQYRVAWERSYKPQAQRLLHELQTVP